MASTHLPMETAPRDGFTIVWINTDHGEFRAYYLDCGWLRGENPEIDDCWRLADDDSANDIELDEARGWRPT